MPDSSTSVEVLRQTVRAFVDARDWRQFHSPKNLAMSMAIEAAELMEHFQWLTIEQSRNIKEDRQKCAAAAEEIADVLCYLLALANELEIDVSEAMLAKMKKNETKYPADEFRGRYGRDA